jgi:hypothetical protein
MGLIKEPLDIDFYVDPEPLTDEERALISKYIQEYKARHKKKTIEASRSIKPITNRPRLRA